MPGPKRIDIGLVKRVATKRGPTSSDQWNDSWGEAQNDLSAISKQWNDKLIPLFSTLPDGTGDLDAFVDGLDGRHLYVDSAAVSNVADNTYYNTIKLRPRTVKEQFGDVYSTISSTRTDLENQIEAVKQEVLQDTSNFFLKDGTLPMTGTLKAVTGSVSNPGLTFSGDEDTGLWRPVSNELALGAGGLERMRLRAAGGSTLIGDFELSSGDLNLVTGDLQMAGVTALNSARALTVTSVETAAFKLTTGVTSGYVLKTDASGNGTWQPDAAGVTDHGALTGLGDDDHTQYANLNGRSGGQTLKGGTAPSEDLTLSSTDSGSKGNIFFGSSTYDEANNRLGLATTSPLRALDVVGAAAIKSAASNGTKIQFDIGGSSVNIKSDIEGSGSPLPLRVLTSGVERLEVGVQGLQVLSGDVIIDGGELFADGDIRTTSGALEINGTVRIENDGDANLADIDADTITVDTFTMPTGAVAGYHLVTDGGGTASWEPNVPVSGVQGPDASTDFGIVTYSGTTGSVLRNNAVTITEAGRLQADFGVRVAFTAASGTYNAADTDYVIAVNTAASSAQINLPSASSVGAGSIFLIKDSAGNASTNNITVSGVGGETFDGAATDLVDTDYGVAVYTSDGTNYLIM